MMKNTVVNDINELMLHSLNLIDCLKELRDITDNDYTKSKIDRAIDFLSCEALNCDKVLKFNLYNNILSVILLMSAGAFLTFQFDYGAVVFTCFVLLLVLYMKLSLVSKFDALRNKTFEYFSEKYTNFPANQLGFYNFYEDIQSILDDTKAIFMENPDKVLKLCSKINDILK